MGENRKIQTEITDQVLYIKLDRPEKRNAINDDIIAELEAIFSQIPSEIKCIILHSTGKHFSAGLDLSALRERSLTEGIYHSRMWHKALDTIQYASVPVVAVLKGACVGGGLEIAAACHIRVAEKSTFYALPEGQRGIFVGGGGSVRISKLIGAARMTDMMLTGRVYTAEDGEKIGLSQYICEEGEGLTRAREIAHKITANAPMTNYALIQVLPRIVEAGKDSGLMMESLMAAIAQEAPEAKQRLHDFLEGRAKKVGE